jgi:outer membrane lipoprotein carrier protein
VKNDDDKPLGLLNEITVHILKTWALRAALAAAALPSVAQADSLDQLRGFVRDTKFGRADFTQTVTAPDGVKKKVSTGTFEFSRPNRFRARANHRSRGFH